MCLDSKTDSKTLTTTTGGRAIKQKSWYVTSSARGADEGGDCFSARLKLSSGSPGSLQRNQTHSGDNLAAREASERSTRISHLAYPRNRARLYSRGCLGSPRYPEEELECRSTRSYGKGSITGRDNPQGDTRGSHVNCLAQRCDGADNPPPCWQFASALSTGHPARETNADASF